MWSIGNFLVSIGCFAVLLAIAFARHYGRVIPCPASDRGSPTWDLPTGADRAHTAQGGIPCSMTAKGETKGRPTYGDKEKMSRDSTRSMDPLAKLQGSV